MHHAKEEGVEFMTLFNPVEYLGDENGHVRAMRVQRMELGEPDASGRRSPVAVEGDIREIPVDLVIVSVGVFPNPLIPSSVEGLSVSRRGTIEVDETSMESSVNGLFAGLRRHSAWRCHGHSGHGRRQAGCGRHGGRSCRGGMPRIGCFGQQQRIITTKNVLYLKKDRSVGISPYLNSLTKASAAMSTATTG